MRNKARSTSGAPLYVQRRARRAARLKQRHGCTCATAHDCRSDTAPQRAFSAVAQDSSAFSDVAHSVLWRIRCCGAEDAWLVILQYEAPHTGVSLRAHKYILTNPHEHTYTNPPMMHPYINTPYTHTPILYEAHLRAAYACSAAFAQAQHCGASSGPPTASNHNLSRLAKLQVGAGILRSKGPCVLYPRATSFGVCMEAI